MKGFYQKLIDEYGATGFQVDFMESTIYPMFKTSAGRFGVSAISELFSSWIRLLQKHFPVGTKVIAVPLVPIEFPEISALLKLSEEELHELRAKTRADLVALNLVLQEFDAHRHELQRLLSRYGTVAAEVSAAKHRAELIEQRKSNVGKLNNPDALHLDEVIATVREGTVEEWEWFSSTGRRVNLFAVRIAFRPPPDFKKVDGELVETTIRTYLKERGLRSGFEVEWVNLGGGAGAFRFKLNRFSDLRLVVDEFGGKPQSPTVITYRQSKRTTTMAIEKIWGVPPLNPVVL